MKLGIVTDSTCDIDPELIEKFSIKVIPLTVSFGSESYKDKVNLTSDEFFTKLTPGEDFPATSQPALGDFANCYQDLARDYDHLISLHLSGGLSGTCKTAQLAANQVEGIEVEVIDSGSISIGLGFLVLLAAKLVEKDWGLNKIVQAINQARNNLKLYFTVQDLSYMEHGGRIGKASAFLGSLLQINPVLEISTETGKVDVLAKARGEKRARKKMIELVTDEIDKADKVWLGLAHGDRWESLVQVRSELTNYLAECEINYRLFTERINSTLACHVGPSVYAVITLRGGFLPGE